MNRFGPGQISEKRFSRDLDFFGPIYRPTFAFVFVCSASPALPVRKRTCAQVTFTHAHPTLSANEQRKHIFAPSVMQTRTQTSYASKAATHQRRCNSSSFTFQGLLLEGSEPMSGFSATARYKNPTNTRGTRGNKTLAQSPSHSFPPTSCLRLCLCL